MSQLRRPFLSFCRKVSTLQRQPLQSKALLAQAPKSTGRRFMGHGPDISGLEAVLYIMIGGGGFAAWGLYKTFEMRDTIEAFETGKVIPFRSLSDEELLEFRERFREMHGEEE